MPKIGKPPPLPPGLAVPEHDKSKPPADTQRLPPPPSYDESLDGPSGPPPGWHDDSMLPSTPPPTYEESLRAPPGPPPMENVPPPPSTPPPSYEKATQAPALGSEAMDGLAAATALLEGKPPPVASENQSQIDTMMRQLDGIKTGSTLANYSELGLGAAAAALNSAGLLDAYVVACHTMPVAQGATTALSVLDGVKAVYDHHQIGKDIGALESDLNNAQKIKIVAEFVGHDDLLRTVDRSAMVDRFLVGVLESAQTDKELDAIQAGLQTAAGISGLTGALTGGTGLAVGAALELATLTMDGVKMVADGHQVKQAEKSRVEVDKELAQKFLHRWANKVGLKTKSVNVTRPHEDASHKHIETQRFTNSLWFKDDLAGVVLDRMMEDPGTKIHQRILQLCGEDPNILDPKVFSKLSEARQKKVLFNIRAKLSGEDKIFEGKKKKFKLAVQAAKVDAGDAITSLRADMAGYEGPAGLAKFWNISTKAGLLYTMAEERGLDADRIVKGLFQRAQDEGPNCEKELHDLLLFNGSVFSRDTQGSTPQGRMEARLNLLIEIDKATQSKPNRRLEACVFDVAVSSDKVLMAQSHAFANITPYAASLFDMAQNRGLDASGLTTDIFMRAVGEGRESVKALHELLDFKEGFWLNDETRLSSEADRMETRLELLQEIRNGLDGNRLVSVQSASLDLARVSQKVEVAQNQVLD